jgi:hypothetical protein
MFDFIKFNTFFDLFFMKLSQTFADTVTNKTHGAKDLETFWFQKRQGFEEASYERSAALVSVPSGHAADFDVRTACVVSDTHAHQKQRGVDRTNWIVLELDNTTLVSLSCFFKD